LQARAEDNAVCSVIRISTTCTVHTWYHKVLYPCTELDVLRLAFNRCCGKSATRTSSSSTRSVQCNAIRPISHCMTQPQKLLYYQLETTFFVLVKASHRLS